jgi:periplasmic protein TonB
MNRDWLISIGVHGFFCCLLWLFSAHSTVQVIKNPVPIQVQLSIIKQVDIKNNNKVKVKVHSSSQNKTHHVNLKNTIKTKVKEVSNIKKIKLKKKQIKPKTKVVLKNKKKQKPKLSRQMLAKKQQKKRLDALKQMEKNLAQEETMLQSEAASLMEEAFLQAQQVILDHLRAHWRVPAGSNRNQQVTVDVLCDNKGNVVMVKLLKSSGNLALDRSAKRVLNKASPLPLPQRLEIRKMFLHFQVALRPS